MELIIASRNSFKIRELRTILEEFLPHVVIRSLLEIPDIFPPTFEHQDFEHNAIDKAVYTAQILQKPAISDESGLIVPYLGGYEASMKAKALQTPGTKLPNTKKILQELQNAQEHERFAFLESAIAFACPTTGLIKSTSSRLEGKIAFEESGPSSFDFASIFIKHEYSKTVACLSASVLERISHRRKSCEKIQTHLVKYFRNGE